MGDAFFWVELLTTDLRASAAFLTGLFGAEILQIEGSPPRYFLAGQEGGPLRAALVPIEAEQQGSHWLGYLEVPDLAKTLATCEEAGGEILLRPEALPYALVLDPCGAPLFLHASRVDAGEARVSLPWIECLTTDLERAAQFYAKIAGWSLGAPHQRGTEGEARGIFIDKKPVGLIRTLPAGSEIGPHWIFYQEVPELAAAMRGARELGGFYYEDPAEVDGGQRVVMREPTGAPLGLWSAR